MKCTHTNTTHGEISGFTGGVSRYEENRAAHGGVRYTETCLACGFDRSVNTNGAHQELGEWGPSRLMIEMAEKKAALEKLEQDGYSAIVEGKKRTVKIARGMAIYDTGTKTTISDCLAACDSWNSPHANDSASEKAARVFYLGLRSAIVEAGLSRQ